MKRVLFALLLLLSATRLFGRIGETEMQISARLGHSTGDTIDGHVYNKAGFTVVVVYYQGRSVIEHVSKSAKNEDADDIAPGPDLTPTEITSLLAVYGDGQAWIKLETGEDWIRGDRQVTATQSNVQPFTPKNMPPLRAMALQTTPSICFESVSYAQIAKKVAEADKVRTAAAKEQAEVGGVAQAFGPLPPSLPLLTPTPTPRPHLANPPYPSEARIAHVAGSGFASAKFDGSGHCLSVIITQSSGSGILDANTINFGKANWNGPPNSSVIVPFSYSLQ